MVCPLWGWRVCSFSLTLGRVKMFHIPLFRGSPSLSQADCWTMAASLPYTQRIDFSLGMIGLCIVPSFLWGSFWLCIPHAWDFSSLSISRRDIGCFASRTDWGSGHFIVEPRTVGSSWIVGCGLIHVVPTVKMCRDSIVEEVPLLSPVQEWESDCVMSRDFIAEP